MKYLLSVFLTVFMFSSVSQGANLRQFLKHSAYGTLLGAGLGTVSLAFSDQPSEDLNNIARGASLGLYAGIMYGLVVQSPSEQKVYEEPSFGIVPIFRDKNIEGLLVSSAVFSF